MDFLLFLYEGIILSHTLKSEFVHKVDLERLPEEAVLEVFHSDGEGGREKKDLTLFR